MTSTFLGQLHLSLARSFTIEVMLQSTSATHAALINSGATGTFVSSELALPGKEISKLIELQLFDGTPATSELITHHHSDVISLSNSLKFPVNLLVTQLHRAMPIILGLPWLCDANSDIDWKSMAMTFETRDAQLAASFFLKSRPGLTIKEVANEDYSEPSNPESIHQPILVNFKGGKSVSTPPNPLSPQANPTSSHATPSEQPPQPGDDTAQPQTNTILLLTPPLTCPEPNITFSKHCPHFFLLPYSFSPNVPLNRFKGPHKLQSPSSAVKLTPTRDAQNPPPPELPDNLDIRIIGAAPFAQIIWEGTQAYQLHILPSLPKEHL
ncbi:hypothetical protein C0995_004156 [Termitomyces sp. Mi166|nr:hypothetical protein C0995_004156 [Termitomyces sp. Mi166\